VHPDELAALFGGTVLLGGAGAFWWTRRALRALPQRLLTALPASSLGRARLAYLQTRQLSAFGPTRTLLGLRISLTRAVAAATATVAEARSAGAPVGELPGLARRVATMAARTDRQLRLLLDEPAEVTRSAAYAEQVDTARVEVRRLLDLAGQLGATARDALHGVSAPELASLTAEVEQERSAIADGLARLRRLAQP
jgi:hypothetical protein